MTVKELFDWVRDNQEDNSLLQPQVDALDNMLLTMSSKDIQKNLSKLLGWVVEEKSVDSKKLTRSDIIQSAKELGAEPATLKAVIDVEARSSGFDSLGRPTILFERHKMWKYLGEIYYYTWREKLNEEYPDVCSPKAGSYNTRGQYEKLAIAEAVDWGAAHMSCSFGLAQVMGFNWESLGYTSLKEFVDEMWESESKQLDAMCRYIRVNYLVDELQKHDWAGFARGYNGSAYRINKYDTKLAAAYIKAKREGW